jgi:hypothetical protein
VAASLPALAVLGSTDFVGGLVIDRGAEDDSAVGHPVPRAVPRALDETLRVRTARERTAGVGAGVVEREDGIALADQHERVDSELGLDELALGDIAIAVELARLHRDPLRACAAERVAADHIAGDVDDIAADVRPGREDQEPDHRQRDPERAREVADPDEDRDDVHDERDEHQGRVQRRSIARRAVRIGVVREPGGGRGEHRQDPEDERDLRRDTLTEHVEHDDEEEDPDRHVRQDGVDRVAEPATVQEVAQLRHPVEEPVQVAVGPGTEWLHPPVLRIHQPSQPASHGRLGTSERPESRPGFARLRRCAAPLNVTTGVGSLRSSG